MNRVMYRTAPPILLWPLFLLLCMIGTAAAVRRIVVLLTPQAVAGGSQMNLMDVAFASRKVLTLCHIVPALLFVLLVAAWFLASVRRRPKLHHLVTYALFLLGAVVGVTALLLSLHPFGGLNESTAAILYDCLFLFSLGRAWVTLRRGDLELHRRWMIRAVAVLLGIATTRPVMGIFFATASITHLQPQQFFGTAFWIGFTATYIAGEAYLRSFPSSPQESALSGPPPSNLTSRPERSVVEGSAVYVIGETEPGGDSSPAHWLSRK
jgi:hypothetical protein